MKNIFGILMIGLLCFSWAGNVTPTISIRFNDVFAGDPVATMIVG